MKSINTSTGKEKEEEKREGSFGKGRQNDGLFWKATVFAL